MSAISETYNRDYILEMSYNRPLILQMFLSQQVKRKVIITNKNGKYKLTGKLPNNVRLKKLSKLHGILVQCPAFFPKWKYWQYWQEISKNYILNFFPRAVLYMKF